MLSYQHIYHAGNLADVHKHMLLAWSLSYMTRKDKPITYIETHAGRGLYDLKSPEAKKTAEADQGISNTSLQLDAAHPYASVVEEIREHHGVDFYPGSPMIAATLLREQDRIHLAELHPEEFAALSYAMSPFTAKCYRQDGFDLAFSLCPPTPRRGIMLIDPSYEIKQDYSEIPKHLSKLVKAWNVGIIALWYPILKAGSHISMVSDLERGHPDAFRHEVHFAPAKDSHGMIGSGMFFINPPFGLESAAAKVSDQFKVWARR